MGTIIAKKSVYLGVLLFLLELFFVRSAFSISYEVDECVSYATGKHSVGSTWTETRGDTKYSCRCDARQGTVCTPISGTRSPSMPSGSLRPSQQLAVGILGALFSGLFSDLFAPPDTSYEDAIRKQQEEKLKKQQEEKRQALEKWMNLQAKAESERLNEEAKNRKKGEEILAQTSIGGGGLKMESIGTKITLGPFNSYTTKLFAAPAPSGQYSTAKFKIMERLLCAAYFSKMAEGEANRGDMEGSKFYGTQMDNVIQGYPTQVECKPPKDLSSIDIKKVRA